MRNIYIVNALQIVVSEQNPQGVLSTVPNYPKNFDSRSYKATEENPNGDEEIALMAAQAEFSASSRHADTTRLLSAAFSLESKSEHPLAKAIVNYGAEKGLLPSEAEDFKALSGNGLCAMINGEMVYGGNMELVSSIAPIGQNDKKLADELSMSGETPLFFCSGKRFLGIISVADVIKEDSAMAISELKNMGLHVVMLTGDNEKTAAAIAKTAITRQATSIRCTPLGPITIRSTSTSARTPPSASSS